MKTLFTLLLLMLLFIGTTTAQTPAISMLTGYDPGDSFSFYLKADSSNTTIQVDFGNGILVNQIIDTSYTKINCMVVSSHTIKMYGHHISGLNCAHNKLWALDVSNDPMLTSLDCQFNKLSILDVTHNTALMNLDCSNNRLKLSTLPLFNPDTAGQYLYAPQKTLTVNKMIYIRDTMDLSSQDKVANDTTRYTWKTKNESMLVPGIDYFISHGRTVFLKAPSDSVYCSMMNASFPDFKDSNVLKTTFVMVLDTTPGQGIWKGSTSTDWNTASNWEFGIVPQDKDVFIPAGCLHYPVLDSIASGKNIFVQDGGQLTVVDSGNLTVNGNLAIGNGMSGNFMMQGGNCTVTGDYLTELHSNTNISGGTFNFTNWGRNTLDSKAVGVITLSGGTINASGDVNFSANEVSGTMNGPFNFFVGRRFIDSDSTWTTVTDGTITMLGFIDPQDVTGENGGSFLCSNETTSAIAYNLTFQPVALKNFLTANIIVKNNLSLARSMRTLANTNNQKGIHIGGDLSFGTFMNKAGSDIYLKGNWLNYGFLGSYTAAGSTVFLDGGNQTITGSSTFYNLTKKVSASAVLTFDRDRFMPPSADIDGTSVEGTLILQGAPGQLLSLRNITDGTPWNIVSKGPRTLSYLNVKDSYNRGEDTLVACHSVDAGNNIGWNFNCAPLSISDNASMPKMKLYPNPTTGIVEISLPEQVVGASKIEVQNVLGTMEFFKQIDGSSAKIDLTGYPAGIYFIRISSGGSIYQSRLIKN